MGLIETYWNLMVIGIVPIMTMAVNTIRKKLLKWSNISVKKYHQSPTLGVKSGTVRLPRTRSTPNPQSTEEYTYVAPHVAIIHLKFPAINVDIPMRASMQSGYMRGRPSESLYFIIVPVGFFRADRAPGKPSR